MITLWFQTCAWCYALFTWSETLQPWSPLLKTGEHYTGMLCSYQTLCQACSCGFWLGHGHCFLCHKKGHGNRVWHLTSQVYLSCRNRILQQYWRTVKMKIYMKVTRFVKLHMIWYWSGHLIVVERGKFWFRIVRPGHAKLSKLCFRAVPATNTDPVIVCPKFCQLTKQGFWGARWLSYWWW